MTNHKSGCSHEQKTSHITVNITKWLLQIVNQKDPNWWQAKKVGSNGPAGLIPSQELEERRKAFVKPEADYVHKISICGARVCYISY